MWILFQMCNVAKPVIDSGGLMPLGGSELTGKLLHCHHQLVCFQCRIYIWIGLNCSRITIVATRIAVAKIVGYLNLHLPLQSVLISTNVVSFIPTCGSVYLKQIYTIKFVSYLRQVLGFLWVLYRFSRS